MAHLEWLLLVGYIDSLFAERTVRRDQPLDTVPETLSQLYLQAMRHHFREAAVLSRSDDRWDPLPDWRLDRHVIRAALYLQERVGVRPGDRVAIVSDLRPDWLIAECAAIATGGVSVAVDPDLPRDRLVGALVDVGPKVVFATGPALAKLDGGATPLPGLSEVISLEPGPSADGVRSLAQALDLGGTLDTPERAQAFRAQARSIPGDHPAICHHDPSVQTRVGWHELTQAEAVERVAALWRGHRAREGDRVYLATRRVTLGLRLALHACLGDGYSLLIIGTPGRTEADLTELGPHRIIAPPSLFAEAARRAQTNGTAPKGSGGWRERAGRLFRRSGERLEHRALRDALGGRVRAIDPLGTLDPALAGRLEDIATVGPELDS